jgi:hypothetical protein
MRIASTRRVGSATTGTGRTGGREERGAVSRASPIPVGSAKFGPRVGTYDVGAKVVARVGGLVSPTLVGVPVGARVGAAHARPRTVRVQSM